VKLWHCKPPTKPKPDPALLDAERRIADVEVRAHQVLADRKMWARDPWASGVLHTIHRPKGQT